MAALCVGGVCVPYTAVVPFLAILLRWFATKLAALGLLPHSLAKLAGVDAAAAAAAATASGGEGSRCCNDGTTTTTVPSSSSSRRGVVRRVESVDEWRTLLGGGGEEKSDDGEEKVAEEREGGELVVVAKFTADWCKPCKKIEPFFERMSAKYDATFVKVDVDELDEIASECGVAMMPTFVVFRGREKAGSVSGADEGHLERLVAQHASPAAAAVAVAATSSPCVRRRGKGDKKRV